MKSSSWSSILKKEKFIAKLFKYFPILTIASVFVCFFLNIDILLFMHISKINNL